MSELVTTKGMSSFIRYRG